MSTAILFHYATKYAPETMGGQPEPDWEHQPQAWKDYDLDAAVALAPFLPFDPNPFTGAARGACAADADCCGATLGALARLIYYTYGVTGAIPGDERTTYLRAAPSAGGLYPTEMYVVVRDLPGIAPGLYGYHPLRHALVPITAGDEIAARVAAACYGDAAVAAALVQLVFTGVFARSRWRYHERAYRRVLLDAGHVLGNAQLASNVLGLRHHLTAAFCDERLNRCLGLSAAQEGALAVLALNRPGECERPSWRALPSPVGPEDAAPPLLDALHRASRCPADRPRPVVDGDGCAELANGSHGLAVGVHLDGGAPPALAGRELDTILHRRSTRRFRSGRFPRAALARILAAAYAAEQAGLGCCPGLDVRRLHTFVATLGVDGLAPGVHYLAPCGLELRPVRPGMTREEMAFLCLGQDLGRDAAAAVIHVADLESAVRAQGDRAYRYLHLDAGLIGERLDLAALAEGGGASGIGGFFDDNVTAVLGLPPKQAVLYITVLGVPG
jgi:SagB-type dehydrogenase family enzyme